MGGDRPPTTMQQRSSDPTGMKRCSFSSVDIREHERIAGDNPCVSSGVPLSLGWGYYQHQPIELDHYESNRGQPRDKIEMMVPAEVRKTMLQKEFGVSINDINAAMREVNITKRNRRQTISSGDNTAVTDALASAKRKFLGKLKKAKAMKDDSIHDGAVKEYLKNLGAAGGVGKLELPE
ncbi:hypothetical protein ACHAXA_002215 [Cyclostephanos tholiformis]|uniref:Uncharacterized protein n=1 Tax=Cyclostephanos tholiformis TaxID=382380 RepID=A0ABD3RWX6_9STRA